jgi:hypothetical protein
VSPGSSRLRQHCNSLASYEIEDKVCSGSAGDLFDSADKVLLLCRNDMICAEFKKFGLFFRGSSQRNADSTPFPHDTHDS